MRFVWPLWRKVRAQFCAKLDNPSSNLLGGRRVVFSSTTGGEIIKFTQNIRCRDLSAVYVALCAPSGGACFISRRPLLHNFKESSERERGRDGGGELGVCNYTSLFSVLVLLQSINCWQQLIKLLTITALCSLLNLLVLLQSLNCWKQSITAFASAAPQENYSVLNVLVLLQSPNCWKQFITVVTRTAPQ